MKRSSGILMAVSSLPSPYGIGTLGQAAYDFADFLHAAGQRYWQMLPLGPTSYGDSPYQSFSAYAGNPYYIDPELLIADGLLTRSECSRCKWGNEFHMMNELARISGVPIPGNLSGLEGRPVLHKDVIDKDAMLDYVLSEVLKK